jgi:hypothetical protein
VIFYFKKTNLTHYCRNSLFHIFKHFYLGKRGIRNIIFINPITICNCLHKQVCLPPLSCLSILYSLLHYSPPLPLSFSSFASPLLPSNSANSWPSTITHASLRANTNLSYTSNDAINNHFLATLSCAYAGCFLHLQSVNISLMSAIYVIPVVGEDVTINVLASNSQVSPSYFFFIFFLFITNYKKKNGKVSFWHVLQKSQMPVTFNCTSELTFLGQTSFSGNGMKKKNTQKRKYKKRVKKARKTTGEGEENKNIRNEFHTLFF